MLPLKDKTVLITRSAKQVKGFINQLQDLGANTITLPLIKNSPINQPELLNALTTTHYDWIVLTSANAVRFFFDTVKQDSFTSKIAAVGSKTSEVLNELGVNVDFTPTQFTAKHLAEELPVHPNEHIFIPRSNLAKDDIVEILVARNCTVTPLSIYENHALVYEQHEIDAVFEQPIDFITFTSGSTVNAFLQLGIKPDTQKIICIGPETAKIARQANLQVAAIASPHTIEGMVNAICNC